MWFDEDWGWMWLAMVPMMALMWALIALVVIPLARNGTDRAPSPLEQLDGRLAAGDISLRITAPGGPNSSTVHDKPSRRSRRGGGPTDAPLARRTFLRRRDA